MDEAEAVTHEAEAEARTHDAEIEADAKTHEVEVEAEAEAKFMRWQRFENPKNRNSSVVKN